MSRRKLTIPGEILEHVPHGARLLVAVSGGIDSCALLHAVIELKDRHQLGCEVVHLDHGIRPESHLDALFVQRLASKYGVPFHSKRLDGPPAGVNDEQWGRQERYRWFKEVQMQRSLDWVLTAHTATDLTETFLMRLVSNKELRTISRRDAARRLLRPLLGIERVEIVSYAKTHGIEWREDPTNEDTDYLRNKVRHVLVPTLQKHFDPRIDETLSLRACAIAEDDEALNSIAVTALTQLRSVEFGSKEWLSTLRRALAMEATPIRWRMCEELFKEKLGFNLSRSKGVACAEFFLGDSVGTQLPGGWQLRRKDGGIVILSPEAIKSSGSADGASDAVSDTVRE